MRNKYIVPCEVRLGELFCGPGGVGCGAGNVIVLKDGVEYSIKHCWANDYDQFACDTYRYNNKISANAVYCEDVSKFFTRINELPYIDVLTFGFPCNDYSQVGEKLGEEGKYGPLYSYGIKFLDLMRPAAFVAENVSGLKSSGDTLAKIVSQMCQLGYTVTSHLYHFEDYGIPQCRHRIVIVGINNDLLPSVTFRVPEPSHKGNHVSCKTALEIPPILDSVPNQQPTRHSPTVVQRLQYIQPGENCWTADLPDELSLNVVGARISQIYRRLDATKPAYTITGSGGGGTHVYHWSQNRALTNRERARLQTFPDSYVFKGPKGAVRRQIGMAVPPLAAQFIIGALVKSMLGLEYPYIKPNIGF
jgi:DNA (cytosine-5)-methyltransferase 1